MAAMVGSITLEDRLNQIEKHEWVDRSYSRESAEGVELGEAKATKAIKDSEAAVRTVALFKKAFGDIVFKAFSRSEGGERVFVPLQLLEEEAPAEDEKSSKDDMDLVLCYLKEHREEVGLSSDSKMARSVRPVSISKEKTTYTRYKIGLQSRYNSTALFKPHFLTTHTYAAILGRANIWKGEKKS